MTELGYLDGVTGAIQTQLNNKQGSLTAGVDYLTPTGSGAGLTGIVKSESDPQFSAWNKSSGISITTSQISNFGNYEPADSTIIKESELSSSTNSTSTITAANSAAVKAAYDLANSALQPAEEAFAQDLALGYLPVRVYRQDGPVCDTNHGSHAAALAELASRGVAEWLIICADSAVPVTPDSTFTTASLVAGSYLDSPTMVFKGGTLVTADLIAGSYLDSPTMTQQGAPGSLVAATLAAGSYLDSPTMTLAGGLLSASTLAAGSYLDAVSIVDGTDSVTTAAAGGNSFSDDFSGSLGDSGKFAIYNNTTPYISSGKLNFDHLNDAVFAQTTSTRASGNGFKITFDLQLADTTGGFVGVDLVLSDSATMTGNFYRITLDNKWETYEWPGYDYVDVIVGGYVTVFKEATQLGENLLGGVNDGDGFSTANRSFEIQFFSANPQAPFSAADANDIVVLMGGQEKLRIDNQSSYSSHTYLHLRNYVFDGAIGNHIVDTFVLGDL
jgi:hypothetical protein